MRVLVDGDADLITLAAPEPKQKKNRELKTEILPVAVSAPVLDG